MTMTDQEAIAAERRILALDLEPVVFTLMHPDPGQAALSLHAADTAVARYRNYLTLCAWYPGELLVPSREIDRAWQAHILDTAQYAQDCQEVFGYFLHHFPYLGMRNREDGRAWADGFARTQSLFLQHWGGRTHEEAAPTGNGGACRFLCGACTPENADCDISALVRRARPRPDRIRLRT